MVESAAIRVEASRDNAERLTLMLPGAEAPSPHALELRPTRRPRGRTGRLSAPAPGAARRDQSAIRSDLASRRADEDARGRNGRVELRAVTGPDYGRIFDHELVGAVQRIAGNGTGDTRWKVPGVLDWSTGIYNPRVDITRDTTTLYARSRCLSVPGRRPQPDRGGAVAQRLARTLLPRLLLLELGGRARRRSG